jgi:hypothetical protein
MPREPDDGLSVVLRTHGAGRLPLLDQALFSIAVQSVRAVQVIVVVQGHEVAVADVEGLIARQPFDPVDPARPHRVVFVDNPDRRDRRAQLLNQGIDHAQGRYLAFLDDDDVVYPTGYRRLIDRLSHSEAAIAVGGTVRADLKRMDGHWITCRKFDWVSIGSSQRDLFDRNFLPLHSFVIDRTRVTASDLRFDESLARLEDYDFLLRLAARYRFDLGCIGQAVCEYRLRAGAGHANPIADALPPNDPLWAAARAHIARLKRDLEPAFHAMPRTADTGQVDWLRALQSARRHSGGWLKLAVRLVDNVRMHGPRRVLNEARRLARRPTTPTKKARES